MSSCLRRWEGPELARLWLPWYRASRADGKAEVVPDRHRALPVGGQLQQSHRSIHVRGLVVSGESSKDESAYTHRVMNLARCLEERSIPCDFFYPGETPWLSTWTTASLFMLGRLPMLRQYDFLYTGCEEAGQSLFFCRPFLKGPIIYDIHGDIEAQSALEREIASQGVRKKPALRVKIVSWMAMACADYVVTVSDLHTDALIRRGVPPDRVGIIRNGVDLGLFGYQPMLSVPEFTFGYAGEFQGWQGIDNLIGAFEMVRDESIRMLLVGFTPQYEHLKNRLADRFGNRVKLVDRTDRETLVRLLARTGVLIIPRIDHPAIRHAFPTKFAEYAATGRAIMVNDVDETAAFVRKYRCGFVSDCSPEAMAAVMEQAARTPVEELTAMGRRARSMAQENFSWPIVGEAYADLVREVVQRFDAKRASSVR